MQEDGREYPASLCHPDCKTHKDGADSVNIQNNLPEPEDKQNTQSYSYRQRDFLSMN